MSDSFKKDAGLNMGFATILFLLFLTLKLTHVINWPWLWVFSPFLVNVCLYIICLGLVGYTCYKDSK